MSVTGDRSTRHDGKVRYEPDDHCPPLLLLGVGLQGVMMVVASFVLIVAVTARAGGQDDIYLTWAVFAALVIAGALTALQASRFWRLGSGHILIMGPTLNFVAVSVLALEAGGPALLAILTVASSLFYIMLSIWLPFLRRILTPAVSGTVLMLIAVSVLPIALNRIREVPDSAPIAAGPVIALATLTATTLLALRAPRAMKPWSPLLSLLAGCVTAAFFGVYDIQPVVDASWAGIPSGGFPGIDLTFGREFWTLLPAFVVITFVGGVKNMGDSVAVQQASRRQSKVTDFRLIQGALNTNGLGILLSGLAGTPPTTAFSARSVTLIALTSVAARRVGYVLGATLVVLALFPKLAAVLISIPNPVMGAFILTVVGMLFVSGVRTLMKDGLDSQTAMTVAVAFALGAGVEQQTLFADLVGGAWAHLLDNGVVVGGVAAVALTTFVQATSPMRQARIDASLTMASLPQVDEFLSGVASKIGWNERSIQRLRSAGEETLISLVEPTGLTSFTDEPDEHDDGNGDAPARLIVIARPGDHLVELEFLAVFDEENLEDRLAYLSEEIEGSQGLEGEISLRLLRHYASSVQHQKYHGLDVVTVQVRGSR